MSVAAVVAAEQQRLSDYCWPSGCSSLAWVESSSLVQAAAAVLHSLHGHNSDNVCIIRSIAIDRAWQTRIASRLLEEKLALGRFFFTSRPAIYE